MFPMTVQGVEKLRKELDYLRKVRRPQIIASIADAREHGDLKENAEYQAAREQQSFCEGRIKELEYKLAHTRVIDITKVPPCNRVLFGTTVTLLHHSSGGKYCYRIVGDDEADSKNGLISINSPIARGLINKSCDSEILIKTPGGEVEYTILQIEHRDC